MEGEINLEMFYIQQDMASDSEDENDDNNTMSKEEI